MSRDRGFALLIVLWAMVLLGLLGARIAAAARSEAGQAQAVAARATLEAAADGAVAEAAFHLASGQWAPDDRTHDGPVPVRVENEAGRIDVNIAPTGLLDSLLLALGLPADRAMSLAAAISDWHTPTTLAQPFGAKLPAYRAAGLDYGPRNAPFESLAELGLVLGMTPETLAALEPHVTVFTEGNVDLSLADPIVRTALIRYSGNLIPAGLSIPPTSLVLDITATARDADGDRYSRVATIRLSRLDDQDDPLLTILAW